MRKFKYNGSSNLGQPENLPDLLKFFDIFNDVLFEGILSGWCKVEWYDSTAAGIRGEARAVCQGHLPRLTLDPRFQLEKPWAQISIKKVQSDWYYRKTPANRLDPYLNCLVHEMLHAAFAVYACNCNYGCKQKAWVIHQGHDDSFLAAGYAIEKGEKVDRDAGHFGLLGLDLDLYRSSAVTAKAHAGVNLPPDRELRRLGLDVKTILVELGLYRTIGIKDQKEKQQVRHLMKANRCIREFWAVD